MQIIYVTQCTFCIKCVSVHIDTYITYCDFGICNVFNDLLLKRNHVKSIENNEVKN